MLDTGRRFHPVHLVKTMLDAMVRACHEEVQPVSSYVWAVGCLIFPVLLNVVKHLHATFDPETSRQP